MAAVLLIQIRWTQLRSVPQLNQEEWTTAVEVSSKVVANLGSTIMSFCQSTNTKNKMEIFIRHF